MSDSNRICINCGRDGNQTKLTTHRLKPGVRGGKYVDTNIVDLCAACHEFLNTQFTENEQRDLLATEEAIKTNERMRPFSTFSKKQNKQVKQKDSKERRRKRRK